MIHRVHCYSLTCSISLFLAFERILSREERPAAASPSSFTMLRRCSSSDTRLSILRRLVFPYCYRLRQLPKRSGRSPTTRLIACDHATTPRSLQELTSVN